VPSDLVLPRGWVTDLSPGYSSADTFVPFWGVTGLVPGHLAECPFRPYLSLPNSKRAILTPDPSVSSSPLYPKGNPLTHSMEFTDRDGKLWLAYIEGLPPVEPHWFWNVTALPGRRLRFDASEDSRVSDEVPAGAPFLSDARLQALLDGAGPVPAPPPTQAAASHQLARVNRWAAQAGDLARATQTTWSGRWTSGAVKRRQLRYRLRRTILAVEARLIHLEEIVSGRGRAGR
jgi:hypothetical protein